MKQDLLTQILNQIAEQGIPADVNYRAAVRERLETSKAQTSKGVYSMNTGFAQPRRTTAAVTLVFIFIAIVLALTPQGRAIAQAAWRFFTRSGSDARQAPTLASTMLETPETGTAVPLPTFTPQPMPTLVFQDTCGSTQYPRCSLAQIQARVDFLVSQLGVLPEGWALVGMTGGPEQVLALYRSLAGDLQLYQGPASMPDQFSWPVGSTAAIEPVAIGAVPGEYVQGAWIDAGLNSGEMRWDGNIPEITLRWEANGLRYTLHFLPAKTGQETGPDRTMLVELAAGLVRETAGAIEPTLTPISALREVSIQAGFAVAEPRWLPEPYEFANAVYIPGRKAVCQYYRYRGSEGAPSLVIVESAWALTLQDISLPPQIQSGQQIEIPINTEYVKLGGAQNEQALYASNSLDINTLCSAKDITANHALIWQSGGRSFVITAMLDAFDGRGFLTRLEMRRLAESLTGVTTIPADALDLDHLISVEAAESLAGFDVKTPRQMLPDMRFAYAVFRDAGAPALPMSLGQSSTEVIQVFFSSTQDSIGRYHRFLFFQNTIPPNTLEEMALSGGEWVTIHGMLAVYWQNCYDNTTSGGDTACDLNLSWLDEHGMRFDINAYLPGKLTKEIFLAIAESMQ